MYLRTFQQRAARKMHELMKVASIKSHDKEMGFTMCDPGRGRCSSKSLLVFHLDIGSPISRRKGVTDFLAWQFQLRERIGNSRGPW
jgi:hypothetical protein